MKKIGFASLLFAIMTTVSLMAQPSKIENLNASVTSIEASFNQEKTMAATGKIIKSNGRLYYESVGNLAMLYDTPAGDKLIITGSKLHMSKGEKSNTYDTNKNAPMRSLSSTLLNCIRGKVEQVSVENKANLIFSQSSSAFIVTVKAKEKAPKGYSEIVIHYNKSTGIMEYMKMVEFNGNVTEYSVGSVKKNVNIPSSVYIYPQKMSVDAKAIERK